MTRTASRPDRINLRVSADAKRKLERAAAFSDKTLTDFVVDVAVAEADAMMRARDLVTLTPPEWERFEAMLLKPTSPNARLKRALSEHGRVVRK